MIQTEQELKGTLERISFLAQTVSQIRQKAETDTEFRMFSNAYLLEIEKMQAEVYQYLNLNPSDILPAKAA